MAMAETPPTTGQTYDELLRFAESQGVEVLLFLVGLESSRAYMIQREIEFRGDIDSVRQELVRPGGQGENPRWIRELLCTAVKDKLLTQHEALQALVLEEMDRANRTAGAN